MEAARYRHLLATADLAAGLADHSSPLDDRHLAIVEQVQAWYGLLKKAQAGIDPLYLPAGEWEVYVNDRRGPYATILHGPTGEAAAVLGDFWRNDLGPIVSHYAYYPDLAAGREDKVARFLDGMCRDHAVWTASTDGDAADLVFPHAGNPWGVVIDGVLAAPQSYRFHHQASRALDLVADVDRPVVLEIGGGFGGMAMMLHRLAGRPLTYVDLDLPETLTLAAYYLLAAQPHLRVLLHDPTEPLDRGATDDHDVVLAANFAIEGLTGHPVHLFLNAFSLSEMPAAVIANYLGRVQALAPRYILHNNVDRADVVNRGHPRTPGSRFPIDPAAYKRLYRQFDHFQGHDGDYREFLYERRSDASPPT